MTPYRIYQADRLVRFFFEYGNMIDHIDDDTLHPFVGGKVTVPTEGKVSTMRVELVVPEGVELVSAADTAAPMTRAKARLEPRSSPGVENCFPDGRANITLQRAIRKPGRYSRQQAARLSDQTGCGTLTRPCKTIEKYAQDQRL